MPQNDEFADGFTKVAAVKTEERAGAGSESMSNPEPRKEDDDAL
jgi:hypothetical protein